MRTGPTTQGPGGGFAEAKPHAYKIARTAGPAEQGGAKRRGRPATVQWLNFRRAASFSPPPHIGGLLFTTARPRYSCH